MNKYSIFAKNVLIKEINGDWLIKQAKIDIEDNVIINVLEIKNFVEEIKNKQDNDIILNKELVSPAFVNPHTHLAMSFFRGLSTKNIIQKNMIDNLFFEIESKLSKEDVLAFTRVGAYECLSNGIGMVFDHYYFGEAVACALYDCNLSGIVAPTLQDIYGPGVKYLQNQLSDVISINNNNKYKNKHIYAGLGTHATNTVSENLWKEVIKISADNSLIMHTHVAQTSDEYKFVQNKYSLTPYEFLHKLGALDDCYHHFLVHNIYLKKSDLSLLNKNKNTLIACPFSQLIFQFPANFMLWHQNNFKYLCATDCVASNDSMNIQKELKYLAGLSSQSISFSNEYNNFIYNKVDITEVENLRVKNECYHKELSNTNNLLNIIFANDLFNILPYKIGNIAPNYIANLAIWDIEHASFWPNLDLMRTLVMGDTSQALKAMIIAGKYLGNTSSTFNEYLLNNTEYKEHIKEANERLKYLIKHI